ncbi:MAG TPA: LamG-like jellyroll fold domain-containing protein [Verrucomicrobiae bacterium]|nr:LamG-like jellyroll fold domain-containing protein [Verrucomicrobiae bacterium]
MRNLRTKLVTACVCLCATVPYLAYAGPSTQAGLGSIPYSGIWSNGSTAGSGFGAWQLSPGTNGGNAFFYVQSSTQNNNGGAAANGGNDIDASGVAWGITAMNGVNAQATRSFPGALSAGQTFQIDMDNGNVNSGGSVGFALQNGSGQSVWEFYFNGGASTYTINASTVSGPSLPSVTHNGMRLIFSQPSTNTYSVSIISYTAGGAAGVGTTNTYTGNLLSPGGGQSITSVRLFNFQAGTGTNNNAYFNNLGISGGAASDSASNTAYNTSGTTFRVWAPNATAVHVAGSWNGFSTVTTPLYSEGNGNWSADVTGAIEGMPYQYYISNSTVGTNVFKQDPRSRRVLNSAGRSYIYNTTNFDWGGDNFTAPSLGSTVIYELNIGSFYDPNSPSHAGTFYDATNQLAYLQQLGVNAVEVMPISEFPGDFSWGYNPADIFAAESAYGGPDGFKTFVKIAHQYGIAVILDVVHNHYGGNCACNGYGDLTSSLWQFDGSSSGGYGGIYFYQDSCRGFAQTWGPRPNFDTPQVYQYIVDNIRMWMDECHVDGFRWDSVGEIVGDYPCNDFLASGATLITNTAAIIHSAPGNKINIGEDQNYVYGTQPFDATWNNNAFLTNVLPQLTSANDSTRSMSAISYAVNMNHDGGGLGNWGSVVFLEDHDQCGDGNGSGAQRLPVRIDNNNPTSIYARRRSMLGSVITLSTAGIPMLLQGEEMLTTNQFGAVIPIDWSYTNTYSSIVSFYTDMIRLRRNLDGRSSGLTGVNTTTIWSDSVNKIIAYRRYSTGSVGDDVVVVCNFANTNWPSYNISNFPHDGTWYTQLNTDWNKYSSDYGNYGSATVNVSGGVGTISIAPYSALILSQNVPGEPPTPQNLQALTVGTNQVTIAWDTASGATGYIVKRGGSQIATTSTNVFTDNGLSVGVQYCYSVAATNLAGVSADSAQVCVTTLPATGDTGLLANWAFDEASGSIAYDSSGNSNTGVVSGSSWSWTSGMFGSAIHFGGYDQVAVPNSASLNPVQGITVSAWVNADNWYNYPRILEKGSSDNQYGLFVNPSGQLVFLVSGVTNGTVVATPPSAGAWHHIAGTYDGSLISLYIDGQVAAQQAASGQVPVTTDPLAVGFRPGASIFYYFQGTIDDVRIYGSALSGSQIGQQYQTDTVGDGIANWWRQTYFGSSSTTNASSCAICDADGTGQDNYFKYVAGLNPLDPNSVLVLQISPVAGQPSQVYLTFSPVADGRTYTAQSSDDLTGGSYNDLTNIGGPQTNGNQVTITDLSATQSNEFYRLHISLP